MRRRSAGPTLLVPLLALLTPGTHGAPHHRPVAVAVRRTGPIVIDGHLNEAAWKKAPPVTNFTQQKPHDGARPTQRTVVRFLYDNNALYIGARMYDTKAPGGITARLARRDDNAESDVLAIKLDTYHDRLHDVEFDVFASGSRRDVNGGDFSWNPVWQEKTSIDSAGWTAEMRIPFSQLHFSTDSVQTWGLEIVRIIYRNQERDLWSYYPQNEARSPSLYGTLTGLHFGHMPLRADLLPYVVARTESLGTANPSSPFYDPRPTRFRVGGNLRYLLSNSFTLSATVNPDFGQVEVDPAVVNLTAFETYFPEKRPFFVEGSNIFSFGSPGCNINCGFGLDLYYSRRIGEAPPGASLAYNDGAYAKVPGHTTILGAAKLTGRTNGGTTVGLIDAVTNREMADVATSNGTRLRVPVAPLTNDFVGRVKQDLDNGNLVLGGILTSADRRLHDPALAGLLPSSARAAGVDAEYFWDHHTYRLYAALSASRVAGDSAAILQLQQSSARYFQRPDRSVTSDGLFSDGYDPGARVLSGYGAIARVQKRSGNWIGDLNAAAVSPGFATNGLGFMQKADWLWLNGSFGRQFLKPTRWYRTFVGMLAAERYWNYDGDVTQSDVTAFSELQLLDYWDIALGISPFFRSMSDRLTRGGPVVAKPGGVQGFLDLTTDSRRAVVFSANIGGSRDDAGGYSEQLSLSASLRPSPNIQLTLGPSYDRTVSTDQYVTAVADPTATAFYGNRYVFAHLDEKQLAMETRANITFSPGLSLELYAQPLIASADYTDFEQFAQPRGLKKLVYGHGIGTIDTTFATSASGARTIQGYVVDPDGSGPAPSFTISNPNFDLRSLRGTAVLRWEWRPGSTLYLVWTQTRSASVTLPNLALGRDLGALGGVPADNILLLKVTYWLGR